MADIAAACFDVFDYDKSGLLALEEIDWRASMGLKERGAPAKEREALAPAKAAAKAPAKAAD